MWARDTCASHDVRRGEARDPLVVAGELCGVEHLAARSGRPGPEESCRVLEDPEADPARRFRAACALALYDPPASDATLAGSSDSTLRPPGACTMPPPDGRATSRAAVASAFPTSA